MKNEGGVIPDIFSDFYENLLNNQERLGEDFEKILNENLWELL